MQKPNDSFVINLSKKDKDPDIKEDSGNNQDDPENFDQDNNIKSDRQTKATGILLGLFSILLLIAFISYSAKDDINVQISIIDLIAGSDAAKVKIETTHNWLGIFGALLSDFFYNGTIGYGIILLPFFLLYLSRDVFLGRGLTDKFMKNFGLYLILATLLSCLLGTIQNISWLIDLPKEFSGAVGMFMSTMISKVLGTVGAFLIFTTAIGITIFLGFDISVAKIPVLNSVAGFYSKLKDRFTKKTVKDENKDTEENVEAEDLDENRAQDKPEDFEDVSYNQHEEPAWLISHSVNNNQRIDKQEEVEEEEIEYDETENRQTEPLTEEKDEEITSKPEKKSPALKNLIDGGRISSNIEEKAEEEIQESHVDKTLIKDENEENKLEEDVEQTSDSDKTEQSNKLNITIDETPQEEDTLSIEDDDDEYFPICTNIHDEKIKYSVPHSGLLDQTKDDGGITESELQMNARILQEKLETFKIYIENLTVTPGPVVTQYEFIPAAGIKVSKIESFADDLAMALKAPGIRIIAPIPGKGTVGIEIPNSNRQTVRFFDSINSEKYRTTRAALPLALGKTISGEIYIADLAKMPHLLIAGSTGAGKSVGINTIIASLLYKKHPSELKFVVVDPKKVELQQYAQLQKHFLAISPDIKEKIVTEPKNAVVALKATVLEMEKRYDILAEVGQRNIKDYNKKVAEGKLKKQGDISHRPMPYIVVIIDELADLMLTAGKEVEEPITRLAQMARAVGIHLIVATQRPSVDVITGLIKANFPARIAYLVATKIDSRTILDMQGAEKLLGMGDMLILPPGSPKPVRIQNAFISTDEVDEICDFIGGQRGYSKPYELPSLSENDGAAGSISPDDRDPLFEEAARLIVRNQQGSVSLVQRRLKVGYARAGRIVDELEAAGVVGPFTGSKARDVLLESESELEAIL